MAGDAPWIHYRRTRGGGWILQISPAGCLLLLAVLLAGWVLA